MLHIKKYFHIYILIFLNVLNVFMRIPDFYRPFWSDELITIKTTLVNPLTNPLYDGFSTNLPLFYYFVKIFSFLFQNENLRISSLFFSIILLNIFLYRYLKNNEILYLITAIFIPFSPIQIYYSTELRTYMLTQLLLVLQFFFLKDHLEGKKVNYYLWGFCIFLSLISHYTAYIYLVASGLYLIVKEKKISESVIKSYIFPSIIGFLVLVTISGNSGFSNSTENSILNLKFSRFQISNIKENILRLNEVLTIYYNFGLHYYRLDNLFTSLFKKFIYFIFLIPFVWVLFKNKFKNQTLNLIFVLLITSLFLAISTDLMGFIVFAVRYIFPFHFLYLLLLSFIIKELFYLNKIFFVVIIAIFLIAFNLYSYCLFTQLKIYVGNGDPQGKIIQSCFK